MAARRSRSNENGNGEAKTLVQVLEAKHEGLKTLVNSRFDNLETMLGNQDKDRAEIRADVDKIDGRIWKIVIGVGGVGLLELLHLILKR